MPVDRRAEPPDVETSSRAYGLRFAGPVGAWFLSVQARAVLDLLRPWPAARVLDLGGGHGQLAASLAEAGHQVTVYGSPGACGEAVQALAGAGRVALRQGDLSRAPWPDRSFDAAVCVRLLAHAPAWRAQVAELCRLAARAVVVDYPTSRSLNAASGALFGWKRRVEGDTRPFAVFTDAEVDEAFTAFGFHTTARRRQFLLPMALHRAAGMAPVSRAAEAAAGALGLTHLFGSPVILRAERRG